MIAIGIPGRDVATQNNKTRIALTRKRLSQRSGERGSAILEYAFALVVSLVLLFGIVDFARALYSYHFISDAAREATRYASVRGALCSVSANPCPITGGDIQTYVTGLVPAGINSAAVTVTPTWQNPNNLPVCNTTNNYPGCAIQVKVAYTFNFIFPYNFDFFNFTAPPIDMSTTSQMIISR